MTVDLEALIRSQQAEIKRLRALAIEASSLIVTPPEGRTCAQELQLTTKILRDIAQACRLDP